MIIGSFVDVPMKEESESPHQDHFHELLDILVPWEESIAWHLKVCLSPCCFICLHPELHLPKHRHEHEEGAIEAPKKKKKLISKRNSVKFGALIALMIIGAIAFAVLSKEGLIVV
jgi:hypothetical protein